MIYPNAVQSEVCVLWCPSQIRQPKRLSCTVSHRSILTPSAALGWMEENPTFQQTIHFYSAGEWRAISLSLICPKESHYHSLTGSASSPAVSMQCQWKWVIFLSAPLLQRHQHTEEQPQWECKVWAACDCAKCPGNLNLRSLHLLCRRHRWEVKAHSHAHILHFFL